MPAPPVPEQGGHAGAATAIGVEEQSPAFAWFRQRHVERTVRTWTGLHRKRARAFSRLPANPRRSWARFEAWAEFPGPVTVGVAAAVRRFADEVAAEPEFAESEIDVQ
jgi:hypothetical protein